MHRIGGSSILIEKKGITKSHKTVRTRAYVAVSIIVGPGSSKILLRLCSLVPQGMIWTLKAHSTLRIGSFEIWLGLQQQFKNSS